MSDWEDDMYMDEDEDEELSFEDEDEDENEEIRSNGQNIDINAESIYFQAKNLKEDGNWSEAIELFSKIINGNYEDIDNGEYLFKAIKQSLKIYENKRDIEQACELLERLFEFNDKPNFNKSYFNSSLYKIVNRIEISNQDILFSRTIFEKFLDYLTNLGEHELSSSANQKLLFKLRLAVTNCTFKEGNLNLSYSEFKLLEKDIIQTNNEFIKKSFYLKVLSNEILILLLEDDFQNLETINELRRLVDNTESYIQGLPDSRILGIINEGKGTLFIHFMKYEKANSAFLNSFKNFNDIGDDRRIIVLTKLIIASMISKNEVNLFKSSDFQGIINQNANISLLYKFYNAFQDMDLDEFNHLLKREDFLKLFESFKILKAFLGDIREIFCINYLLNRIQQCEKISFKELYDNLNMKKPEFKQLIFKILSNGLLVNYKVNCIDEYLIRTKGNNTNFIDISGEKVLDNCFKYFFLNEDTSIGNQNESTSEFDKSKSFIFNSVDSKIEDFGLVNSNMNEALMCRLSSKEINNLIFDLKYDKKSIKQVFQLLKDKALLLNRDYENDYAGHSNFLDALNNQIQLLRKSIVQEIPKKMSYIEKVEFSKRKNEYMKEFHSKIINSGSKFKNDPNIPDVIQDSSMNQFELDPPSNPDLKDSDEDLKLCGLNKKQQRLRIVTKTIDLIGQKQQDREFYLHFLNYGDNQPTENWKKSRKERALLGSMSSERSNDTKFYLTDEHHPIIQNAQKHTQRKNSNRKSYEDQSETTSVDNMSVDGEDNDDEEEKLAMSFSYELPSNAKIADADKDEDEDQEMN